MSYFGSRLRSLIPPLFVVVIIAVAIVSTGGLFVDSKASEAPAPAISASAKLGQAAGETIISEVGLVVDQATAEPQSEMSENTPVEENTPVPVGRIHP